MSFPFLGHGVGLRVPHYERALASALDVDWVELISENFFGEGGRPRAVLERVRRDLPFVLHGVSLGVGSPGAPVPRYLARLAELVEQFEPAWVSDHLCWAHWEGQFSHDLLPLPYTEEALRHVVENVQRVQDALRRPILLENVSSYVAFSHSQMPEWQFLSEVAQRSGCLILLDLNNILVSAFNHGFEPRQYLEGVPGERVQQLHLANHSQLPTHKFDDHRGPVPEAVWTLYDAACRRFGPVSSSIEWDEDVPSWEELRAQQRQAALRARDASSADRDGAVRPPARPVAQGPAGPDPAPPLPETQALFFRAITWPTGARAFLAQAGDEMRRAFARSFADGTGFDATERMEVYANSYFYRLLSALREMFPRLCFLSGEVGFHNLVTDYVLASPSREPDLRRLGERLPEFVRGHALGARWPLLVEVALLERALNAALDAPDAPLLDESDLARLPVEAWPELRLEFSPPTRCLSVRWDLEAVEQHWATARRNEALDLVPAAEPRSVIIGRRGYAVYFRSAGYAEAHALGRLWEGGSFAAACAELEQAGAEFQPAQIVEALRRWLGDGMISALHVSRSGG